MKNWYVLIDVLVEVQGNMLHHGSEVRLRKYCPWRDLRWDPVILEDPRRQRHPEMSALVAQVDAQAPLAVLLSCMDDPDDFQFAWYA